MRGLPTGPVGGYRKTDYIDLKKVAELIRTKDLLTTSGLKKIKEIPQLARLAYRRAVARQKV